MTISPVSNHRWFGRVHRRNIISALLIAACILLIGILSHPLWLPGFYTYLDVSEPPRKADVIVVLGGSEGRREPFAVELYKEGYAPTLLVSGSGDDSMQQGLAIVRENGIPSAALITNDQAANTYDEAQRVLNLLLQTNAKSALIVTDLFHTRRASATYAHVFQGHDIVLTFVSPDDDIDPDSWWTSNFKESIAAELLKLPYYWFVYGI